MDPKQKRLVVVVAVLVVAFVAFIVVVFGRSIGRVSVNLTVSPQDSKVTLDGQPVKAGRIYLSKGVHTFKATRQYFTDTTLKVDTKDLESGQIVYLLLGADTPEAKKYLLEHPAEIVIREAAGAAEAQATQELIRERFPVIADLPYETIDYKIAYSLSSDNRSISFTITLFPVATTPGTKEYRDQLNQYKSAALNWLKSKGIDTSKADITVTPDPDKT